jgi:hypothetical protein
MTTSNVPRSSDDGSSVEANGADLLEQAQPAYSEPASDSLRRAAAPISPDPSGPDGSTADQVEQAEAP